MDLNELLKKLSNEIMFEFDKTKKIGHLRCQFGYDNQIANQFVSFEDMDDKVKKHQIDLKRVNEVCNVIQFDWIQNYEKIESLCPESPESPFGRKEINYFLQDSNVNYWIRLNPFGTTEYNCYIHIYHQ